MHRVWRRYSSSTTGWISTSGKRRGVRRRGRNERLVLDVYRSFLCFPFLFLPSPTPLERHCTLPENFIYVEISRATASKPATRPDTSRRRPRHSPSPFLFSSLEPQHAQLSFLCQPSFILSVHPFFPALQRPFSTALSPGNDIRPIFHGIRIPSKLFLFYFPAPNVSPPRGKLINALIERRGVPDMPMEILLEMKTLKRGAAVERDSKLESRRSTRRMQGKSGRYVIGERCGLDGLIGERERERFFFGSFVICVVSSGNKENRNKSRCYASEKYKENICSTMFLYRVSVLIGCAKRKLNLLSLKIFWCKYMGMERKFIRWD